MKSKLDLSPEEQLTHEFAYSWRADSYCPALHNVDGLRFAKLLTRNRMAVLAMQILSRADATLPNEGQKLLLEQAERYERSAAKLGSALINYLKAAEVRGIETIVLKGLWLCEKIYRVPSMRPGGDIDILVQREDVDPCLDLLAEQGIGEFWPNLLHDDYFTRHHLHQQRSTSDLNIWFEIHWALDHPYTLLTVDYESIFARAKPAKLLGAPIQEMAAPDLLLGLAIHLVKHAVYLPSLLEHKDLLRIILADGMLMYFLDITEVLRAHPELDWSFTVQLAHDWGAVDILGSVLQVCRKYFDAPVPDHVLRALPITEHRFVTRKLMERVAEQKLADYEERKVSRFWKLLLAPNGAFILRPVRALETISYLFPPADFLRRCYRHTDFIVRIRHILLALTQTLRLAWDTFYFGLERYFRLKRLGQSASLFNKLETHL